MVGAKHWAAVYASTIYSPSGVESEARRMGSDAGRNMEKLTTEADMRRNLRFVGDRFVGDRFVDQQD
jgi:hypothetical protein